LDGVRIRGLNNTRPSIIDVRAGKLRSKGIRSSPVGLLRAIGRTLVGVVLCQHHKLVYPPSFDYEVCFRCGKKRLRDPLSGHGYGKWSHDLNALIAAQDAFKEALGKGKL
jgi:hypothetical protein